MPHRNSDSRGRKNVFDAEVAHLLHRFILFCPQSLCLLAVRVGSSPPYIFLTFFFRAPSRWLKMTKTGINCRRKEKRYTHLTSRNPHAHNTHHIPGQPQRIELNPSTGPPTPHPLAHNATSLTAIIAVYRMNLLTSEGKAYQDAAASVRLEWSKRSSKRWQNKNMSLLGSHNKMRASRIHISSKNSLSQTMTLSIDTLFLCCAAVLPGRRWLPPFASVALSDLPFYALSSS